MNKVSFFIVGAPKTASTSLTKYLSEHPEIEFPVPKDEPVFGDDLYIHFSREEREDFIERRKNKNAIMGESCVWYLYSKKAAKDIYIK